MGIDKLEWHAIRDEIKLGEPKTDCFAYDGTTKNPKCRSLTDLYCRKEECRFYKPGTWNGVVGRCGK